MTKTQRACTDREVLLFSTYTITSSTRRGNSKQSSGDPLPQPHRIHCQSLTHGKMQSSSLHTVITGAVNRRKLMPMFEVSTLHHIFRERLTQGDPAGIGFLLECHDTSSTFSTHH